MYELAGTVAVVTGATRGAGRGIALELGNAGATVYVTGRSTRADPSRHGIGTIEDTAEAVTRRGGKGIPVRCDHTKDEETAALFDQVRRDSRRLDLLVNNAWGGNERPIGQGPFWELPIQHWEEMFTAGVRAALVASRLAVPLMIPKRRGLIITNSFYDRARYIEGILFYDLAKNALCRLAFGMAHDLKDHGIASVALSPGFMRTELVLKAFNATEETWRTVPALAGSETTAYIGRAVVALAKDWDVFSRTGQTLVTAELARYYGFTDADGSQPEPFRIPTP